jgi:hypothetical protein
VTTKRYNHIAQRATTPLIEARWLRLGPGRVGGSGCCALCWLLCLVAVCLAAGVIGRPICQPAVLVRNYRVT